LKDKFKKGLIKLEDYQQELDKITQRKIKMNEMIAQTLFAKEKSQAEEELKEEKITEEIEEEEPQGEEAPQTPKKRGRPKKR